MSSASKQPRWPSPFNPTWAQNRKKPPSGPFRTSSRPFQDGCPCCHGQARRLFCWAWQAAGCGGAENTAPAGPESQRLIHLIFGPKRKSTGLVAGRLFEKGEVKTFYFNFSEIIRRYMESIRYFPAAEMTTEEIVRRVGNNSQDQEILTLLRQADLVKFADAAPVTGPQNKGCRGRPHLYSANPSGSN